MKTFLLILSYTLTLGGAFIVLMNWVFIIANTLNSSKSKQKHYRSPVYLLSVILCAAAYAASSFDNKIWLWILPAIDPANWMLLALPFLVLFKNKKPDSR